MDNKLKKLGKTSLEYLEILVLIFRLKLISKKKMLFDVSL